MAAANRVRRLNIPTLEPTFPFWPSNPKIVVHRHIPIWGALRFTCRSLVTGRFCVAAKLHAVGRRPLPLFYQRTLATRSPDAQDAVAWPHLPHWLPTWSWHVGAGMRRDEGIQVPTRSFR
jgi:hypothetical protein